MTNVSGNLQGRWRMENKDGIEIEYDFEEDTRRKLEEFLKDPKKNASSIELCKKILESDLPF